MDFNSYKVQSRYALQINDGYSSRLNNGDDIAKALRVCCTDCTGDEEAAFIHGWNMADRDERRRK